MIPVPTIALAMPPPGSPTGFGISVKNARSIDPNPLAIRYAKIAIRGAITSSAASVESAVASQSVNIRKPIRSDNGHLLSARDAPDQQLREKIDQDRHNEQ